MGETQKQAIERQDRLYRAALPGLLSLCDSLELLYQEIATARVSFSPDDTAALMTLTFLTKHREHLRSVRALVRDGLHRDAFLIARTMLEGLCRHLWALNRVPDRTDRWYWFGIVLDWRRMQGVIQRGTVVDPQERGLLWKHVVRYGPNYFQPGVRKDLDTAIQQGTRFKLPPDPWVNDWTDTTVADMFRDVQAKDFYDVLYREGSEWIHWGPRSIVGALELADWGYSGFSREDMRSAFLALFLGCLAVLQTLQTLDRQFSLDRTEQIDRLFQMFNTNYAEALAAARNAGAG